MVLRLDEEEGLTISGRLRAGGELGGEAVKIERGKIVKHMGGRE